MWCENCKRTFGTDEKNCPECGKELIDYTPILDEDSDLLGINEDFDALVDEDYSDDIQVNIEVNSKLLVTVIGEKEAKRSISLLNDNHIPASCKVAEVQTLEGLDGIEWDEDFEEDEFEEEFDQDVEVETLTPPTTEDDLLVTDETLYDIFVPEKDFPEAMSLMLEKDKDRDATLIDNLAEIIPTEEEFEESFEEETVVEEEEEEIPEEVTEETEKVDGEKTKGGFWNLFRK